MSKWIKSVEVAGTDCYNWALMHREIWNYCWNGENVEMD